MLLVLRYNTPKYRFVVRFSRKALVCQIVYATVAGDVTVAAAYSQARPADLRPGKWQRLGAGETELRTLRWALRCPSLAAENNMFKALSPGPPRA